jgi:D-alanyl-D-alanine carboxypeptidase
LFGGWFVRYLLYLYLAMQLILGAPLDTLIDREHGLPLWYDPGLKEEALEAWLDLQDAAEADGLKIIDFSDYRSYSYQERVFARETDKYGGDALYSTAWPGYSEHQLGTAFDVAWPGVSLGARDPRNERLYAWLESNAQEYGFILSYPFKLGAVWPFNNRWMPMVTEYIYEPWHIRYLGKDLAKRIFDAGYLDPMSPVLPQDFLAPWP